VVAAAAAADRDRLLAARREDPDDAGVLLALLANISATGDHDLAREVLEETAKTAKGRALAIALHELALLARGGGEATRAAALWARAYEIDQTYEPLWMPLAESHAAADEPEAARDLYDKIAESPAYDASLRQLARERADALGAATTRDVVSGEISPRGHDDLARARQLAEAGDLKAAIEAAQAAAERAMSHDHAALELLETLYLELGDITAASEAIGRQLVTAEDPVTKATLWRRRAKIYRSAIGRDAEAYRCLKEAHACNPADPEISYLLRTAAMVRDEWALAASLLYREIAATMHPRDRGALHLELALIYLERLDDPAQAQVNFEQALAFDPTIPAAKAPLAKRYEAIGRHADAAKLYDEAAKEARPADRATLLASAQRARTAAAGGAPDLAVQIERAEASGDLDGAVQLAHQLWGREPGNARAFRVLANVHRAAGDLDAMTALTTTRAGHTSNAADRASAWLDVARLAEEIGQLDQAARAYDLALAEEPLHAGALDARGALAFRLGDYTTADLIYKDIAPGDSVLGSDELALRRSIIAEKLGRDSEALELAQVAQAASPARRDIVMRVQELATRMGELDLAIVAARKALELIPLDDEDAQLGTHFQLVDLLRQCGKLEAAIAQLERVRRDHPMNAASLELLAELHTVRGDWPSATRYLYQLVPLAPTPALRADRLYRLGEAVLVHLGDVDRADDVFLRASDLDPNHLPTLRRLIDVYWRADDPGALVEVASELAARDALVRGAADAATLAHALVAAAMVGETTLAERLGAALGDEAPRRVASALTELADRAGARLKLESASTAIAELGRRGLLDLQKVRAHVAGTPVESVLS
jgi:Tfp pilus assembly protein PilF